MRECGTSLKLPTRGVAAPAEAFPLRLRPSQSGVNPFLDTRTLELRDRSEYSRDEPTGRRARVDPLAKRHERDPARLPLVEQQHEMAQIATEAIEPPADDSADAMPAHIPRQLVEYWPAIFGAADRLIDVLDGLPTSSLDVAPKLEELVLAGLIVPTGECGRAAGRSSNTIRGRGGRQLAPRRCAAQNRRSRQSPTKRVRDLPR
jgi:hypothetical protein